MRLHALFPICTLSCVVVIVSATIHPRHDSKAVRVSRYFPRGVLNGRTSPLTCDGEESLSEDDICEQGVTD